jgi:hypothetical protein
MIMYLVSSYISQQVLWDWLSAHVGPIRESHTLWCEGAGWQYMFVAHKGHKVWFDAHVPPHVIEQFVNMWCGS